MATPFANYTGPFEVGTLSPDDPSARPFRHNDGSMIIMGRDGDGDRVPVMQVMMRGARPKRGEAWKTSDHEQEAFAAHVVALLNGVGQ